MTATPVFRFAPSPNGPLHLGHAYSALLTFEMARACGGRFLLRIEDIDIGRCRPEFEAQILDDLAWLGITWEEPVRRQSEHLDFYQGAVARLREQELLFPCFASRKEIAAAVSASGISPYPHDPDGVPLYPGLSRTLSEREIAVRREAGEAYALRLDSARAAALGRESAGAPITFRQFDRRGRVHQVAAEPERWGDAVIARKDIGTSYHLSVVLDDALQGVTHVTRGRDLLAATDLHTLLQILLGLPRPLYHHHRLIPNAEGRKLSKSRKGKSLKSLRKNGVTPDEIRALLGLDAPFGTLFPAQSGQA